MSKKLSKKGLELLRMLKKVKASRGKTLLMKHLRGKRLTQREAILAKCCDCDGYYTEGKKPCQITTCSLISFSPYKPKKVKR